MTISLASISRPNSVSIFAAETDKTAKGKILAFVLTNAAFPDRRRVRLDTVNSGQDSRRWSVSRNPLERYTTDAIVQEPGTLTVSGTLSANPLSGSGQLGALGSTVRLDLRRLADLYRLAETREPMIVVCPWDSYASQAISSIDVTHPGSNKVDLTITFEEIRIVSGELVDAIVDVDELLLGAPTSADAGGQPTEAVPAPGSLGPGGLGG